MSIDGHQMNATLVTAALLLALLAGPSGARAAVLQQEATPTHDAPITALADAPDVAEVAVGEVIAAAVDSAPAEHESADSNADSVEAPSNESSAQPDQSGSVDPLESVVDPVDVWLTLEPPYSDSTPLPRRGKAMYYNPGVMAIVIDSRNRYDQISICEGCIGFVAMLRAGDLDRRVWLQTGRWKIEGPFHVVDTAATQHVGLLLDKEWVVDVDYATAQRWKMRMPIVTLWETPPLHLLLATDAIPLSWTTTIEPKPVFRWPPRSFVIGAATADTVANYHMKRMTTRRYKGARPFIDMVAAVPNELYVK